MHVCSKLAQTMIIKIWTKSVLPNEKSISDRGNWNIKLRLTELEGFTCCFMPTRINTQQPPQDLSDHDLLLQLPANNCHCTKAPYKSSCNYYYHYHRYCWMKKNYLREKECTSSLDHIHSIDGSTESIDLLMWISNHDPRFRLSLKYICHGCKKTDQQIHMHVSIAHHLSHSWETTYTDKGNLQKPPASPVKIMTGWTDHNN